MMLSRIDGRAAFLEAEPTTVLLKGLPLPPPPPGKTWSRDFLPPGCVFEEASHDQLMAEVRERRLDSIVRETLKFHKLDPRRTLISPIRAMLMFASVRRRWREERGADAPPAQP